MSTLNESLTGSFRLRGFLVKAQLTNIPTRIVVVIALKYRQSSIPSQPSSSETANTFSFARFFLNG
jgi:hypothetical protein